MEIIRREMPADYDLYDLSDFHLGSAACNTSGIKKVFKKILKKDNRFVIIKGDIIDGIPLGDKRMQALSLDKGKIQTPQEQAEEALTMMRPIRDRILFLQFGNHEATCANVFNALDYWCSQLDVPWGGFVAKFAHLKDGKHKWKGFFSHGRFQLTSAAKDAIQEKANLKAALRKKLQRKFSDVIVASVGHSHKLIVCEPTYSSEVHIYDDGKSLKQTYRADIDQTANIIPYDARWYVNTGSFHRTYSEPGKRIVSYSEMALFDPTEMGYVVHKIRDHKYIKAKEVVV